MKEQGKYTDHIPEASANFINRSLNADGVGEDIRSTTVEFLPFGLDWTCVAEIQFSENKDLPNDNDPPRRQKVRNSTVETIRGGGNDEIYSRRTDLCGIAGDQRSREQRRTGRLGLCC